MRRLLLSICFLFNICILSFGQVCTSGPNNIGGLTFNDFNENGVKEAFETGQSGIGVKVYDCNGTLVSTTTSDQNGNWSVTVPTAPSATVKYRVEFTIPTSLVTAGLQPALNGTSNRTSVQFISAATCSAHFGTNFSGDYCQGNPPLAVPCYEPGNLVYGATGNTNKGLITISYNSSGPTATGIVGIAGLNDVGNNDAI